MALRPSKSEYSDFYQPYLDVIPEGSSGLIELMNSSLEACNSLLEDLDSSKENYRYADGKWSVKELLLHIIDAERVFAYRALRFARNDSTELRGFDENLYVEFSDVSQRSLSDLLKEFNWVRKSNILMFESLDDEALSRMGRVEDNPISVRALGFIICGHLMHHLRVIQERYL